MTVITFPIKPSLVDLDPCEIEECIRESGWVIVDKVYTGKGRFGNRPGFKYSGDVPTQVEGHPDAA